MAGIRLLLLATIVLLWGAMLGAGVRGDNCANTVPERPNMILILADDMGYSDIWTYGNPSQESNELDDMASEGLMFTHMYAADSICTPSRASLLTGRYAARVGMYSSDPTVRAASADSTMGLPRSEVTIAELLRDEGYNTGIVGKWHLGINSNASDDGYHLPIHHGFNYVGYNLPLGNMFECDEDTDLGSMAERCFLYYNDTIIQQPFYHEGISELMLDDAKNFISENKDDSFFLYMSLIHPHVSLYVGDRFKGASKRGAYGDNINEMAYTVGQVLEHLEELNIAENTLVVFTSDHGAHIELCYFGGLNSPFKGGKSTFWEGGIRVPAIFWMPGSIQGGEITGEIASLMDIYTTFATLGGAEVPSDRAVDGLDLSDVVFNCSPSPHDLIFHYCNKFLMAVRYKNYKIVYRTQGLPTDEELWEECVDGRPMDAYFYQIECAAPDSYHDPPILYDILQDPGEHFPISWEHHTKLYNTISDAVEAQEQGFEYAPPLFDETNCAVSPCCDPPRCECGYDKNIRHAC